MRNTFTAALFIVVVVSGCQSPQQHAEAVRQAQTDEKLTLGKVQREIRVGMTSAEVVEVLGSPNMVTTDDKRRESWVYDKISTDTVYSNSSGGVNSLILGGGVVGSTLLGGGVGGNYNSGAGAKSTTQRTLTIIVKFDESNKVRDFSYRSSAF